MFTFFCEYKYDGEILLGISLKGTFSEVAIIIIIIFNMDFSKKEIHPSNKYFPISTALGFYVM